MALRGIETSAVRASAPQPKRLRRATDEMIAQIKYLNRVVINLQTGMLDREGGQQEIQQIQNQLLEIVRTFPIHAGVEGD